MITIEQAILETGLTMSRLIQFCKKEGIICKKEGIRHYNVKTELTDEQYLKLKILQRKPYRYKNDRA